MCIEFVSFETSKTSRSIRVIIISTLYSWYVTVEVGLLPRAVFRSKREGDVRHDEGQDCLIAKTRRKDEGPSGSLSSCGFGVGWRREVEACEWAVGWRICALSQCGVHPLHILHSTSTYFISLH